MDTYCDESAISSIRLRWSMTLSGQLDTYGQKLYLIDVASSDVQKNNGWRAYQSKESFKIFIDNMKKAYFLDKYTKSPKSKSLLTYKVRKLHTHLTVDLNTQAHITWGEQCVDDLVRGFDLDTDPNIWLIAGMYTRQELWEYMCLQCTAVL